ncbi:MAG TPA: copper homeostasis protein CutC [Granulicella sp.]|jgi:copper homeostasis protein|nr:copper homeostasis protein CutC [Granulicella sp.]
MQKIVFELCAESVEACDAGRDGGAHRIELCSALSEGGLTPSHGLIRAAIERSGLPVHVLLRPRSGDFLYTTAELEVMRDDLKYARSLGASGAVLGFLHADGSVDIERASEFVALAGPLEVTFHRAFDYAAAHEQALEAVIAAGCSRVLTSGGERDVVRGATPLALLVKQAAGRIDIAVGGGLRLNNAAGVARVTGARHFHGSLRRRVASPMLYQRPGMLEEDGALMKARTTVESADVRQMIENLTQA